MERNHMSAIALIAGLAGGTLVAATFPRTVRAGWRLMTGGYFFKDEPPAPPIA